MAGMYSYNQPRVSADLESKRRAAHSLRTEGHIPGCRVVVKKSKVKQTKRCTRRPPQLTTSILTQNESQITMAYIQRVKRTFSDAPEIYQEFVHIMSLTQQENVDLMELINKVVILFDGHPELIFSFDAFLPDCYELELQDDAVVVKIYEPAEADEETMATNGKRGSGLYKSDLDATVEYIKGVKKTFVFKPEVYHKFMGFLEEYHSQKINEVGAIRHVVELFRGHANLILAFNAFLPPGYGIHMYEPTTFTIQYRNERDEDMSIRISSS